MSVLIVTSLGDIEVDLFTEKCPLTSKNFLKLCKMKYYNGNLFHTVQKDFTAQTGDPTGTGSGGESFYKFLYGDKARFFKDEINLDLKHAKTGTLAMASGGENLNASQFYITLRDDLDYLDGKHSVFGEVVEGFETLTRINEAFADENGRPLKNIRIKHTYIIDDPFEDPTELVGLIPDASPEGKPKDEVEDVVRLEDDWVPMDEQMGAEELVEVIRAKEAHSRAVVLETIGDIPDAEIKPPENVLFVCKLNPVTEDDDLHTIFSRFGTVTSAEIIRDYKTGDSLCYAFIEFELQESCEAAYFKMDNALIDDRRIHVDFSQSVSKLWSQYRRKDHQTGKGCFKCGETDHIAKDCTSSGPKTKQEDRKYVIKDENRQRGGGDDSRYEMVFDDDGRDTPRHEKRRHSPSYDKPRKRDSRARENRDSREYRDRRENRDSRESQDKEYRDSRESRDEEYRDRRKNRDKEYRDGRESRDKEYRDSRESQDEEYRDRRKNRDKEYRDGRESRDKEYRDKEYRDGRESRDKEYRDSRENQDKKESRDRRDEEKKEHRRR